MASLILIAPCFSSRKSRMLHSSLRPPQLTRETTRKTKKAALFILRALYSDAAALLENLKLVHKQAFSASESTFEDSFLAQLPSSKASGLSAKPMFLSTMSVFSNNLSDRRAKIAARAKNCSHGLVGAVCTQFVAQREIVALWRRKYRSPATLAQPALADRKEVCRPNLHASTSGFGLRLLRVSGAAKAAAEGI